MATAEQLRSRVAQLVRAAGGDFDLIWSKVAGSPELLDALADLLPSLIGTYGPAIGFVAADWYDDARAEREVRGRFQAVPADIRGSGVGPLLGWAAETSTTEDALKALILGGLQRRLANFSRQTVMQSTVADPQARGWMRAARVTGCDFCRMLAGRGAVYTEASVKFGAHDDCGCQAVPAWGGKADVFDVQEYRRSVRRASLTEEQRAADNARARDWIAANL